MSYREVAHSRIQTSGNSYQLIVSGLCLHADRTLGSGGWVVTGAPAIGDRYTTGTYDIQPILVKQEIDPNPASTPGESSIVSIYAAPKKHELGNLSGKCIPVIGRWELEIDHLTGQYRGTGLYSCPNKTAAREAKNRALEKWPHPVDGVPPKCLRARPVYDGFAPGQALIYCDYGYPNVSSSITRPSGKYQVFIANGVGASKATVDKNSKIIEGTDGTDDYRLVSGGTAFTVPFTKILLKSWFSPGRFSVPNITKNTGKVNRNSLSKLGYYGSDGHLLFAGTSIYYRQGVEKVFVTLEFWHHITKWNEQTTSEKGKWVPMQKAVLDKEGAETSILETMVVWKAAEKQSKESKYRKLYDEVGMSGLNNSIVW